MSAVAIFNLVAWSVTVLSAGFIAGWLRGYNQGRSSGYERGRTVGYVDRLIENVRADKADWDRRMDDLLQDVDDLAVEADEK